jgi:hypothetical protein
MKRLSVTVFVVIAISTLSFAQLETERFDQREGNRFPTGCTTQGWNLVDSTTCATTPSESFIDASVFTGDACAKIAAAIATLTLPTSVTIDARGITGTSTCTGATANPFSGTNVTTKLTGQLLLGQVTITTPTQWTVPNRFWIRGIGLSSASSVSNTIIQAGSGALTCTTTLTIGSSSYCPLVFIGPISQDVFAAGLSDLTVDCASNTDCIGAGSATVQEGGGLDNVSFINQTIACVDFDSSAKTTGAGISNDFIRNINCTFPSTDTLLSSADGILINASEGPAEISNVTVSVPGETGSSVINDCVYLNGAIGTNVNYLHCEHAANILVVGDANAATEVNVHGVTSSATITNAGIWLKNAKYTSIQGLYYGGGGGTPIIDGTNSINITDKQVSVYEMSTASGPLLTTVTSTPSVLPVVTDSILGGGNYSSAPSGAVVFCSDCKIANPCAGSGTGALAVRNGTAWVCK